MDAQILTILHRIEGKLVEHDSRFDTLDDRLDGIDVRLDQMDGRFDGIDVRLDGIDVRLDGIDVRLDGIDVRLDGIDVRLDGIDVRLDGIDVRLDQMDGRLDQHAGFHAEHRREFANLNTFLMAEFNQVYHRLDKVEGSVVRQELIVEQLRSDFRAFGEGHGYLVDRLEDHEQRLELLEQKSA